MLTSRAKSPAVTPFPLASGQSLGLVSPHAADSRHSSLLVADMPSLPMPPNETETNVTVSGKTCPRSSDNKADGSDWITSLVALTSHGGKSYCALGEGGFWKRSTYAATRAMVAHRYNGMSSFDDSQIPDP